MGIPEGFKPGLLKIGPDGDLVTNTKSAQAIVLGYVRKGGKIASESDMETHVNKMKSKGALRSNSAPKSNMAPRSYNASMTAKVKPMGIAPAQTLKPKKATMIARNRGE